MLGRQFNVIATEKDLELIEAGLRRRGDVRFLSSATNESRDALLPLKSLRVEDTPPHPLRRLCFLAPSDRPLQVEIIPVSDVKVHINVERSEIIEFGRSYCESGEIQRDRLYYTPRYFEGGAFHEKDANFVRWAENTVASIKRVLNYDKAALAQVGPDAARRISSGELRVIR